MGKVGKRESEAEWNPRCELPVVRSSRGVEEQHREIVAKAIAQASVAAVMNHLIVEHLITALAGLGDERVVHDRLNVGSLPLKVILERIRGRAHSEGLMLALPGTGQRR